MSQTGIRQEHVRGAANLGQYAVCQFENIVEGDLTLADFEGGFKLVNYPTVGSVNNTQPMRGGSRMMGNPRAQHIGCVTEAGGHIPTIFQSLVKGENMGETTITELVSDGTLVVPQRELKLQNTYIIDVKIVGSQDGIKCFFLLTFDGISLSCNVADQEHTAAGQVAAELSFVDQTVE